MESRDDSKDNAGWGAFHLWGIVGCAIGVCLAYFLIDYLRIKDAALRAYIFFGFGFAMYVAVATAMNRVFRRK